MYHRSLLVLALCSSPAYAQTLVSPYDAAYSIVDLGAPAGVPMNLGGCAVPWGETGALYLSGATNTPGGAVYRIPVVRDAQGHVTGFGGAAVQHATAPGIGGGLECHPRRTILYSRDAQLEVGMIRWGSSTTNHVQSLAAPGFTGPLGALQFVPYSDYGVLKYASYATGQFGSAWIAPNHSNFTFNVLGVSLGTTIGGGPKGFVYTASSPYFELNRSMLVCQYDLGEVAVYDLDWEDDPLPATRRVFLTGFAGVEGAARDYLTGDFFFTTNVGGGRVIALRGSGLPCGRVVGIGTGLAGSGGLVPRLGANGCSARGWTLNFVTAQGLARAPGIFFAGEPLESTLFGGVLHVRPLVQIPHLLDASGGMNLPIPIPNHPSLQNSLIAAQALYFDIAAPQQVSFTNGLWISVL
jgi:hypothetical protein